VKGNGVPVAQIEPAAEFVGHDRLQLVVTVTGPLEDDDVGGLVGLVGGLDRRRITPDGTERPVAVALLVDRYRCYRF
jgi:hypothetical protein